VILICFIFDIRQIEYLCYAFIMLMGSILSWKMFLWERATPYIRITRDEIMIFPFGLREAIFIQWNSVEKINRTIMGKVELLLSYDKKVKIHLSHVDPQDRDNLARELQERFDEYKRDLEKVT